MMSISHWGLFGSDPDFEFVQYVYWELPYFDAVFPGGKTGREIARENLKRWAANRWRLTT